MKDKTINIRIPMETFRAIDAIAKQEDRSFNAQVKRILAEYAERHKEADNK